MKPPRFYKQFIVFCLFFAVTKSSISQIAPIGCNAQFYISDGPTSGSIGNTKLNQLTFSGGSIITTPQTLNPGSMGFNAMGINPIDGYIYAIRYPVSGAKPRLVRIGTGTPNQVDLGPISGTNNDEIAYAGCCDSNGDFYFTTTTGRFLKISNPITSLTATQIKPTGFGSFYDIAINPVDGQMYAVSSSTTTNYLFTIDKTLGTIGTGVGPTMNNAGYIAGLFFDEIGQLYGYRADGKLFQIDKTNGVLLQIGSAASYSGADGCSCSSGRVFHDLSAPAVICQDKDTTFNILVSVTNQSSVQQTGLVYTLTLGYPTAVNKISFTETPAVIAARLFSKGFLPTNNSSQVVISSVAPGTNNKITITSFQTKGSNVTDDFTLQLRKLATPASSIAMQSVISGLPAAIGGSDLSNNPNTAAPDDPTIINLAACGPPLPVDLLSFTGSYKDNSTLLNWVVASEINSAYYTIERSTNSIDYCTIGTQLIAGNSYNRQQYRFTDNLENQYDKLFYYRLKIVDIDGRFKFSNIVLIRKNQIATTGIKVSPNPVMGGDLITVRFDATDNSQVELSVIDMTGRIVATQQNSTSAGTNSVTLLNVNNLKPGMYIIRMNNASGVQTTRLIITQ